MTLIKSQPNISRTLRRRQSVDTTHRYAATIRSFVFVGGAGFTKLGVTIFYNTGVVPGMKMLEEKMNRCKIYIEW